MTPSTLLLVLASALVHATWNLWTKQIGPGARSVRLQIPQSDAESLDYNGRMWSLGARRAGS